MFKIQPYTVDEMYSDPRAPSRHLLPAVICAQESTYEAGGILNDYISDASYIAYQCNCIVFSV